MNEAASSDSKPAPGPAGHALQHARESRGLSREQVADQLNLLVAQVQALEEDDFKRFNAPLFVKGHLKKYADWLDVDPKPMLDACDACFSSPSSANDTSVSRSKKSTHPAVIWGPVGVVALLLIWGIYALFFAPGEPQVQPMADLVKNIDDTALVPAGLAALRGDEPEMEPDIGFLREPAKLELAFSEEVWVQVDDADGNTLLSGLQSAGSTRKLQGNAPFEVTCAYWLSMSVRYNDKPLVIEDVFASRAARMRIGEL